MTIKQCPDHPTIAATIEDSGNQPHIARARCSECDRFLGWVARSTLLAEIGRGISPKQVSRLEGRRDLTITESISVPSADR
jgi:hypothetical protein